VPSALDGAHEAYLRSDWLTMNDRVRDVLLDRSASELVRQNAFELLDKAYEATNGKLPSRFALPPGFRALRVGSTRGQHAWATYRSTFLYVQLETGLGQHVKDVSLRMLPGVTVLDRAAGIGDLRITPRGEYDEVVLEARNQTGALPDGVAQIDFTLDDGREANTWVLVRGLASSTSPEIVTPTTSATFADASPTFEWTPFRSPEYAPFEGRTLSIYVSEEKTKNRAFDHWTGQPGELAKLKVDTKLAPGSYWLALTAGEERRFGPISLARLSQRGVPFSIVP
jgi:hypothetical protein